MSIEPRGFLGLVLNNDFGHNGLLGIAALSPDVRHAEAQIAKYLARPDVPESAYGVVVPFVALVQPDPRPCPTCGQAKPEPPGPFELPTNSLARR